MSMNINVSINKQGLNGFTGNIKVERFTSLY